MPSSPAGTSIDTVPLAIPARGPAQAGGLTFVPFAAAVISLPRCRRCSAHAVSVVPGFPATVLRVRADGPPARRGQAHVCGRARPRGEPGMYSDLIIGFDGSVASRDAVALGRRLARATGARPTVIYVRSPKPL